MLAARQAGNHQAAKDALNELVEQTETTDWNDTLQPATIKLAIQPGLAG